MKRLLICVMTGSLACGAGMKAQEKAAKPDAAPALADASAVPAELQKFSGMLIGRLVSRDIERGQFTVTVDHVARVWENNKSRQPRAAVGKTLVVEGVTGKWLDSLLLIRPGETIEFEAHHQGGDRLRFPGEWLKKAPPFDAAKYPIPPDGFRGFAGIVQGKIEAKHDESGELLVRVEKIEPGDKNGAEEPQSAVGKPILLGGFWGPKRKPFEPLKAGDTVRAKVLHRVKQSDLLTATELLEASPKTDLPKEPD